jgi:hypothetical protein
MTAGLTIFNSHNTVQIDENYRNLFVKTSGLNGIPSASGITYPLCSVQCADFAVSYTLTNSTDVSYSVGKKGSADYKWWVWDLAVAPVGDYGFQVYNASGQLVFDALQQPMRIVDYQVFTSLAEWENISITYPAGRQYAVIFGTYPSRFKTTYVKAGEFWEVTEETWYGGAKVVDNVVTFGWLPISSEFYDEDPGPANDQTITYPRMEMIVVDVTGYPAI